MTSGTKRYEIRLIIVRRIFIDVMDIDCKWRQASRDRTAVVASMRTLRLTSCGIEGRLVIAPPTVHGASKRTCCTPQALPAWDWGCCHHGLKGLRVARVPVSLLFWGGLVHVVRRHLAA
jgi:hypothetical protein